MKFKRYGLLLLALVVVFMMVACGGTTADDTTEEDDAAGETVDDTADEDAADEEMEDEDAADEDMEEEDTADEDMEEEEMDEGEEMTFTIGVLGPFTGPSARTGEEFRTAAEMAFEAIDYQIGDYTLEVVYIDSQSDPERAARAYEEAIVEDGIQVGVLNWHSSVAAAVMELTARHEVPHFFGFGAAPIVNERFQSDPEYYGYWTTKGWPTPAGLARNYVVVIEDAIANGNWEPENRRAAIYGEDTDWGRSFGDGLRANLEENGWEVVDEQYFPLDQTEFGPVLQRFMDQDVSLIGGTSTSPPSFAAFISQAGELGLTEDTLVIADGLGWVGDWYELTGEGSNYALDQIPDWTGEAGLEFAAEFEERSGLVPSPSSAGLAYDGVNFLIQVLEATLEEHGELSSETVYQTVQDRVWTGELTFTAEDGAIVMEEYNYDSDNLPDPRTGAGYYTFPVLQYFEGEGTVLFPEAISEGELQPPQ